MQAQITITSADMPDANDSLYVSTTTGDNSLIGQDPAVTGANYSWDFSGLIPIAQLSQKFDPPSKFPSIYSLLFNSFNTSYGKDDPLITSFELPGFEVDAAYNFYKESTTSLNQIGVGYVVSATPLPFIYKHPDVLHRFPLNYLNTDSSDFDFGLPIPGYGYYGQNGHRHNLVDGWGELKTPLGTYTTLRVKSVVDITDTIYIESDSIGTVFKRPTKIEYKWLTTGSKIPALQIDAMEIANQMIYIAVYLDTLRKDVIHVGIAENRNDDLGFQLYPNPANEQLTLKYVLTERAFVKITLQDALGKQVMAIANENQVAGTHQQQINIAALPKGIYLLNINSGSSSKTMKVSVTH